MNDEEKKYQEELAKEGVELDDVAVKTDTEEEPEPEAPEPKDKVEPTKPVKDDEEEESKGEKKPDEKKPPLQDSERSKPRSIYHDLKDEKSKVKAERERADTAERERNELQEKLDAISKAKDEGKSTAEAEKDALAYAKEMGLEVDPEFVKRLISDARKGMKAEFDPDLKKDLEEFKEWKQSNRQNLESQAFSEEFAAILPSLQESFPNASAEEMAAIKKELDVISHSKEWHDKDLEYIVFKHKATLSDLVTPKRRGLESKEKKDVPDNSAPEWNAEPDFSQMTVKEMEEWNKTFRSAGRSEGLVRDANGKKMIL